MRSTILFLFLLILCSYGCSPSEEELCDDRLQSFDVMTISGTLYVCNAMPPLQDFIEAEADIKMVGDSIKFEFRTIDNSLDTILLFKHDCIVFEDTIPSVKIRNEDKEGFINHLKHFSIPFAYMCENDLFRSN